MENGVSLRSRISGKDGGHRSVTVPSLPMESHRGRRVARGRKSKQDDSELIKSTTSPKLIDASPWLGYPLP